MSERENKLGGQASSRWKRSKNTLGSKTFEATSYSAKGERMRTEQRRRLEIPMVDESPGFYLVEGGHLAIFSG